MDMDEDEKKEEWNPDVLEDDIQDATDINIDEIWECDRCQKHS
jgi:hypothetical protein